MAIVGTDQVKEILEKTISSNQADQQLALQYIEQAVTVNLPEFLKCLSDVLSVSSNSLVARQAAGLQLKNALTSKDDDVKSAHQQRWLSLTEDVRNFVKAKILQTLGTETSRPSIAAQCAAAIACAEFPHGVWLEVITILKDNVVNASSSEMLKESSLETIGYICADIDSTLLGARSNEILTAIVNGMKKQEPSNHVKLAATKALYNSLEFTKANFELEGERHIIMQVVCETTQSTDTPIKVAALQCLVKIMTLYYLYMEQYMGVALFAISVDAMKSDIDEVALQGIEFWSNVCDEEIELSVEAEEAQEQGRPPEHVSKYYAKGALQYIVPILTEKLAHQEEDTDEDEWNPAKAAGVCLMLLAQCTGDDIIPHTLPFIISNIQNPDWRYRDAAVMAFGSIFEGPDSEKLKPLVTQAMPLLIGLLQDCNIVVKDTAAWCLGRVCDIVPDTVITPEVLHPLLPALSQGLLQEPRVASNVCWAISSLAEAAYESVSDTDESGEVPTYILSSCFDAMVGELLKTTERQDAHQSNLRNAAYEALMELIKNSPADCYETVQRTTVIILQRLQGLLALENQIVSTNERSQFHDLQSLLCATLQNVIRRMKPADAPQISDIAMQSLLQIIAYSGKVGGVQEDAFMAVSTLVEVLGDRFLKYMDAFRMFLVMGLKNHAEYQVCTAAVGLVGDLCRSLTDKMLPYTDELMQNLLEILTDESIDKSVKPQVLSAFGDVALAIGPQFSKYLEVVLQTLTHATLAQVDKTDYDAVDYLNQLREACLEAYTGIIQGLKGDQNQFVKELEMIQPHLPNVIRFLQSIGEDSHPTEPIMAACAGLIGDLVSVFGNKIVPHLEHESILSLLTKARKAKSNKTKTLATWATKEMKKHSGRATEVAVA